MTTKQDAQLAHLVAAAERDYWQRQSDALTCAARLMEAAL